MRAMRSCCAAASTSRSDSIARRAKFSSACWRMRRRPQPVRDQAWFYLGKVLYAAGLFEESDRALRQSAGSLSVDSGSGAPAPDRAGTPVPAAIRPGDRRARRTGRGRAIGCAYGQFNLGVALVRVGREGARARSSWTAWGRSSTKWPELMALRDKANLAIGYAHLQAGEPAAARARARSRAPRGPAVEQGVARRRLGRCGRASSTKPPCCPGRNCRAGTCSTPRCRSPISQCPMPTPSSARWRQAVEYYEKAIAAYDAERVAHRRIDRCDPGRAPARRRAEGRQRRARRLVRPARGAAGIAGIALPLSPARGQRVPGRPQELPRARCDGEEPVRVVRQPRRIHGHGRDAQAGVRGAPARGRCAPCDCRRRDHQWPARRAAGGVRGGRRRARRRSACDRGRARAARHARRGRRGAGAASRRCHLRRRARESAPRARRAAVEARRRLESAHLAGGPGAPRSECLRLRCAHAGDGVLARARVVRPNGMPRSLPAYKRVSPARRGAGRARRRRQGRARARRLADIAIRELEDQRKRLDEYSVQARYALATIYDRATAGPATAKAPEPSP